jgi:chromosome segregation ATPase
MALRPPSLTDPVSDVYDLISQTPALARYSPILNRANASKIELINHHGNAALKLYLEVGTRVYECIFKINKISDDCPSLKAQVDAIHEAAMKIFAEPAEAITSPFPAASMWSEAKVISPPELTARVVDTSPLLAHIATMETHLAAKEDEIAKLKASIATSELEKAKALEATQAELSILRSSHDIAMSTLTSKHKEEVQSLRSHLVGYRQTIASLQSKLQGMQRYFTTLEARYREEIGSLKAIDTAIRQKAFRQWQGERQRLQSQIQHLETTIISLQDTRDRHAETEFRADLETRMFEAMRLDSPIESPKLSIVTKVVDQAILTSSDKHLERIADLEKKLARSSSAIQSLQTSIGHFVQDKEDKSVLTQVATSTVEIASQTTLPSPTQTEELLSRIEALHKIIHLADEKLYDLEEQNRVLIGAKVESKKEIELLSQANKKLNVQLKLLRDSVNSLSDEKETRLTQHHLQITTMIEEAKAREKRLFELERKLQVPPSTTETEKEIASLSQDNKILNIQVDLLRKSVNSLSDERETRSSSREGEDTRDLESRFRLAMSEKDHEMRELRQDHEKQMAILTALLDQRSSVGAPAKKQPSTLTLDVSHSASVTIAPKIDKGRGLLRSPVLALLSIGLFNKIKQAQRKLPEVTHPADPSDFADGGE